MKAPSRIYKAQKFASFLAVFGKAKCALLLIVFIVPIRCFGITTASVVNASTFGAIPNDGLDDTAAIQAALSYVAQHPGTLLQLNPGTYDISAPLNAHQALGLYAASNVIVDGGSATLLIHTPQTALLVQACTNIELRNITFDWAPLPFAQVSVQSFDGAGGAIVNVLGGTLPSPSGTPVAGVLLYDAVNGRPAPGNNDFYPSGSLLTAQSGNLAHLSNVASNFSRIGVGASLVVRYQTYGANAVLGISNNGYILRQVTINSSPGMGALFDGCNNVTVAEMVIDVPTGSGRWISTNADGLHFTLCRGLVAITDGIFNKMGDDAVNLGGVMMTTVEGTSANQIVICQGGTSKQGIPPFYVGDLLEFSSPANPLVPIFSARVLSGPSCGLPTSMTLTLDQNVPTALLSGAVVYDETAKPVVRIARCSVANNRARGFWIQGARGAVMDSIVTASSGPAAELRCDVSSWWEGPAPSNFEFYNCSFANCNYGPGASTATINAYALGTGNVTSALPLMDELAFNNCQFTGGGTGIALSSSDGVQINQCSFDTAVGSPVLLSSSATLNQSSNTWTDGAAFTSSL